MNISLMVRTHGVVIRLLKWTVFSRTIARPACHGTSWVMFSQARWHGATVAVKILRRSDEVGSGRLPDRAQRPTEGSPFLCAKVAAKE